MLHALADAGECEILAMGTCTWGKGNRSVAAVEVLNGYYGRPDNPVRDVFRRMLTPREKVVVGKSWDQIAGHPSWDETAVLIAVRGWEPYFNLERGRFEMVGTEGDDRWVSDPSSHSGRVVEKLSKEQVGKIIDELMCRTPKL